MEEDDNIEKPKLTYEQVRQIINERIQLIEEKSGKSSAEEAKDTKGTLAEAEKKTTLWQCIKRWFRHKNSM